jgi:hypothetical protein
MGWVLFRANYIVNVDHDGYARGPRAAKFAALVQRLEEWAADPANVARFYTALMARVLPADFSAKTLNVEVHGTDIMRQVFGNGRATILDQLEELLDGRGQYAVPESDVVKIVTGELKGNINSTKHLMSDLGWIKQALKWGGVNHKRQLWVRPGYSVQNGKIYGPEGFEQMLAVHLKEDWEIV